jgi:transcriptional regulator with XRE-family HTH domain
MRKRRLDLGLLQKDVASQIGVTKESIYNWETNRTGPEVRLVPHIIDFLGYVPYDPTWPFGQRLRAIRSALGLSQEQLARWAGLDESTVSKWEREEHKPLGKKLRVLKALLRRREFDFQLPR